MLLSFGTKNIIGGGNLKRGKRPTRNQKIRIKSHELNPDNWLVIKECKDCLEIKHKGSNNIRKLIENKALEMHLNLQRRQIQTDKELLKELTIPHEVRCQKYLQKP